MVSLCVNENVWVDGRESSVLDGSYKATFDIPENHLEVTVGVVGGRSITLYNCESMGRDELTLGCSRYTPGIFEQPLSAITSVRANTPEGEMRCEAHKASTDEEAVYACTPNTATTTDTPAPTPTPLTPIAELSPAEVYQQVSSSIAFIETPSATGSAVLIGDLYLITNYHVVWPYESVRVVFPDRTELEGVPVVGWDPMADLAVLGPVDVSAKPLSLQYAMRDTPGIGSEVFLIGYPAEQDPFPEPSITRGLLSRVREWERLGMTYLQADAAVGSGQSGGALVNSKGHVVGISTFSFSDAGFALASSFADVMPIVERLIQGETTSGLSNRRLPLSQGSFGFTFDLRHPWDARAFLLDASAGTMLEVEIESLGDGAFQVSEALEGFGVFGGILRIDDGLTGVESGTVELASNGRHILQVKMFSEESSRFELSSNVKLRQIIDPDDGRTVTVGETVIGNFEHRSDRDWYSISLKEGWTVRVSTDSLVDTAIYISPQSSVYEAEYDDDGGGGLFGTNSELVYRAPHTGEFFIVVASLLEDRLGGYYLSVEPEREGTEAVAPTAVPNPAESTKSRLETVRDRGTLICASRNNIHGFGYLDAEGNNVGFDIDLCRAVAAAVLGDPSAIDIYNLTAAELGPTVQSGEVDMMVRTVTQTTSRDAHWGNFPQVMLYDGQGFMVRKDLGIASALDLKGMAVCVVSGTTTELNLYDFSKRHNLDITIKSFETTDETIDAYGGECQAYTNDRSQLAAISTFLDDPQAHTILPETISEEPLGPVVPHGDDQWFDIVKTVMAILIYGEAYDVSQDSVPSAPTGDTRIDRLLGIEGYFGQEHLGLSRTVAQDVLRAVGNYGEIYSRNLGPDGINLPREGSLNALWAYAPCQDCPKGGLIYAAPLR